MKRNLKRLGVVGLASATLFLCTFFLTVEGEPVKSAMHPSEFERPSDGGIDVRTVNKRAMHNFERTYPSLQKATWYHTEDGGWIASFDDSSVRTVVAYNRNGMLNHTIRYFDESSMPKDLRKLVKSTYVNFHIDRVANVIIPGILSTDVYLVYMESVGESKIVTVAGGDIIDVKDYQKSLPVE